MPEHQQIDQSKKPEPTFQNQEVHVSQTPVSNPFSIIQRAKINPKSLTHADVMQLQHTIGNRTVGKLLSGMGKPPSTTHQAPVQRQEIPEEEEPLQGKMTETIQRQEQEEEELIQGKFETVQRQEPEEEELLQGKMIETVQRQEIPEEEEPLQGKMIGTVQRQEIPEEEEPLQTKRENNTGIPDKLKAGVENLSGIDMSDVKVHYNSSKPAEVGALAYTQGTDIHVAPGQEKHLPHEAWHVVQQAQGRVKPTMQLKEGVPVNDDVGLEHEADVMGAKALQMKRNDQVAMRSLSRTLTSLQRRKSDASPFPAQLVKQKQGKNFFDPPTQPQEIKIPINNTEADQSRESGNRAVSSSVVGQENNSVQVRRLNVYQMMADRSTQSQKSRNYHSIANGQTSNPIQRKLFIGYSRNPREVAPDVLEMLCAQADLDGGRPTSADLLNAFAAPTDYRVVIAGSIAGHHGFHVTGLEEVVRTPSIAGRGSLELIPSDAPAGISFRGRPGWTNAVVNAVQTQPGLENIRHIIPYHLIRRSFEAYLNRIFLHFGDNPATIAEHLRGLAIAIGAEEYVSIDPTQQVRGLAITILTRLNSVEGNLWAGSAEENQRLNSLRIRLDGIINGLEKDEINQEDARAALVNSFKGARSHVYRELILGALNNLPSPDHPAYGDRQVWIDRLKFVSDSAELDAMPNENELDRIQNPQQFLQNIPVLMGIFQNFMNGDFEVAALGLAAIPSPHLPPAL